MFRTHPEEPFRESALIQKFPFQLPQLTVEEVVGLMDQTEGRVDRRFWRSIFKICLIGLIGPITLTEADF
jgi:hypothetical protein